MTRLRRCTDNLPSNLDNNCTSDTSGGKDAILSLTASSLDALDSSSNSACNNKDNF